MCTCLASTIAELQDARQNDNNIGSTDLLTWEQGISLWEVEADVALGVAWGVVAVHAEPAKLEGVTLIQCNIYAWDPALIRLGPNNLTAILSLKLVVPAGVVPVVVCVEDVVQLAASRTPLSAVRLKDNLLAVQPRSSQHMPAYAAGSRLLRPYYTLPVKARPALSACDWGRAAELPSCLPQTSQASAPARQTRWGSN